MLSEDQIDHSILAIIGNAIAWLFIPLGWGKISDGQMKNHYPKGLRRPLR